MRTRLALPIVAIVAFAVIAGFATTASAHPTYATACSTCHGGPGAPVVVAVTPVSNDGTTASYHVTVSNGSATTLGWAVLSGSTNIAHASASSGTFSVPVGSTYDVWGADPNAGSNFVAISPVAPAPSPDPTPTPSPDPTPTPSPDPTPTPSPDPTPTPGPVLTASVAVHVDMSRGHFAPRAKVSLVNAVTGTSFYARANKRGNVTFKGVPYGTYKLTARIDSHRTATLTLVVDKPAVTAKLILKLRRTHRRD